MFVVHSFKKAIVFSGTHTKHADTAIEHLWQDGLFVRQKGDPYYEAKLGVGDLLSGLLRLHIVQNNVTNSASIDWSF